MYAHKKQSWISLVIFWQCSSTVTTTVCFVNTATISLWMYWEILIQLFIFIFFISFYFFRVTFMSFLCLLIQLNSNTHPVAQSWFTFHGIRKRQKKGISILCSISHIVIFYCVLLGYKNVWIFCCRFYIL